MWRRPKFWQSQFALISLLLLPFSFLYGLVVYLRLLKKPKAASIKIICVGNFIVGGAGKTPTTLYLAHQLKALGANPFILSRGYGGSIKETTQVNPKQHQAKEVGDEALMMANYFPTIIGADRHKAAEQAAALGASVAIMDDGFQNPRLKKDWSLLVVDDYGLGNGRLLPAGPLREFPSAALARAQGLLVIGQPATAAGLPQKELSLFQGEVVPSSNAPLPKSFVAFAALGAPEKFLRTLEKMGTKPLDFYFFGDHYFYKEKDAEFLLARAQALNAALITTEKDGARLKGATQEKLASLAKKIYILPITLEIKQGEALLLQQLKELMHEKT
jgi:tetraacyldisaccharide 4'-kinase